MVAPWDAGAPAGLERGVHLVLFALGRVGFLAGGREGMKRRPEGRGQRDGR